MAGRFDVLAYRRLILVLATFTTLVGAIAWVTMNRQEHPLFPHRAGYVLIHYAGASTEAVERLVVDPLEKELAEVGAIRRINSVVRSGVALVNVELKADVEPVAPAWDRVRTAVDRARGKFPEGVGPSLVEDRAADVAVAVIAVTGSDDPLRLAKAAERLERDLYQLDQVSRVLTYGDPGEQITVIYDDAMARQLRLPADELAGQIRRWNRPQASGEREIEGRSVMFDAATEYRTIAEIGQTPIRVGNDRTVPLTVIADVRHEPRVPGTEAMWLNGRRGVALALTVPKNKLNLVEFGDALRAYLDGLASEFAPLQIEEVVFNPDRVKASLDDLGISLLIGMIIVTTVLMVALGIRSGLLVAVVIPFVTFAALALFALGGGVLHQVTIAGMIIALGMLVDNAIVMVESIQRRLDAGLERARAARESVAELAGPLAAATGTTIAAFVPMLLAPGDTGAFVRAVPIIVITVMATSYAFAVLVSPLLASTWLRRRAEGPADPLAVFGGACARGALHRPKATLFVTGLVIVGVIASAGRLPTGFFPQTDRNQLVVDVRYPEGSYLQRTAAGLRELAAAIREQPGVTTVANFAGNNGPRFYYNLTETPAAPETGRLVVETESSDDLTGLIDAVRNYARRSMPDATVAPRRLGHGPPVSAPIELRLTADTFEALSNAAQRVRSALDAVEGLTDIRTNLPAGIPTIVHEIEDASSRSGLSRLEVGRALSRATRGEAVAEYRAEDDPIPIILRGSAGVRSGTHPLDGIYVPTRSAALPLGQVAHTEVEFRPGAIRHYNLRRSVTVLASLDHGQALGPAMAAVEARLARISDGLGAQISIGGESEESERANAALIGALPIGLALLLFCLLLQFNSIRCLAIVMATVPLATLGVIPGLLVTGNPFGFTAQLGVFALMGIVVNNAIVLLARIQSTARQEFSPTEAVIDAVRVRTRPIVLTTVTTIGGLLPLTFTNSTLWPPMAWAIISGLIAALPVALFVVPVLCHYLGIAARRDGPLPEHDLRGDNQTAAAGSMDGGE